MKCNQAIEIMQNTLDQGASARLAESVQAHLEECDECRRAWDRMSEVEALAAQMYREEQVEPPESLHDGIMEAVAARGQAAKVRQLLPTRSARWWGMLAAACLVGVVVLYAVFNRPGGKRTSDESNLAGLQPRRLLASLRDRLVDYGLQKTRDYLVRETVSPERLSAILDELPVPSLTEPEVSILSFPLPALAWQKPEALTAVSNEISGTARGFWEYGKSTLQLLSGSPLSDSDADRNG